MTILLLAGCEMEMPGLADDFEAARAISDRQNATPEGQRYERVEIMKHQQLRGSLILAKCYGSADDPDPVPFQMILAISASGVVKRVYLDRETSFSRCVRDEMLSEVLEPPPFATFYQSFSMNFEKRQPQHREPEAAAAAPEP